MLFNSLHFLLFFPIVTIIYFSIPHRFRWALILGASCYFYMAFVPKYILILATTITIDYFAALGFEKFKGGKRKWLLIASLLSNIGMLAFFKYFNFANENIAVLANTIGWNYPIKSLEIILPIGLSFHTFQSMSYTIDVYRGKFKAERHFGYLATYVMFFPQLVAGPIERPKNVLPQFHTQQKFEYQRVTDGLKWMAWGMFKKVVIADRMALFVNPVYNSPTEHAGPALAFATLAFAIQIYCDFSGYSDIALGSAQILGIKLMKNFDHPYFSKSISEFWRRWHISLSTWFRDYVYIPLGGNRVARPRWVTNLFITFLVSGLWHGANWTFVIWGALHGLFVVAYGLMDKFRSKIPAFQINTHTPVSKLTGALSTLVTFSIVTYLWIFFRANNISDALYIATNIFSGWTQYLARSMSILSNGVRSIQANGLFATVDAIFNIFSQLTSEPRSSIFISTLAMLFLLIIEIMQYRDNLLQKINLQPTHVRFTLYTLLIAITLIFGTAYTGSQQAFIYFQF
jgi:alginate O-acetyltransferase complex protein AlgI